MKSGFATDLSDTQWGMIKELLPGAKTRGRKWSINRREMIDAIFYLTRTGIAWRYLPDKFPKWKTVYDYFSRLSRLGIWREINLIFNAELRLQQGLNPAPKIIIIDSQSVKAQFGEARGYDGFKKIRGRKRHILVDSLGLIQEAMISKASDQDPDYGALLLERAQDLLEKRTQHKVYVDGAYRTRLFWDHLAIYCGVFPQLIIAKVTKNKIKGGRTLDHTNLKPKRWIVERTFAWLNNFRRLSRDYERTVHRSESFIFLAMTQLTLRKLVI